jgi:hypothetical protein
MTAFTAANAHLLEQTQKTIYWRRLTNIVRKRGELFDIVKSNKAYEERMRVNGLGTMPLKAEGTPIAFDDAVSGSPIRTVHDTYALGWRCTMEMMQDDLFNVMNRMTEELADSTADKQERIAWALLDDAYNGTTFTGLDGLALFSTAHTSLRSEVANQSNMNSPGVELGTTGLEALMTMARTTTNDEGRIIELDQSILCVHPNLEHQAYVLLETLQQTGSNNNDVSTVHKGRSGLSCLVVPYLTSTTQWSLHAAPGKNSLVINNRMSPDFTQAGDPDTKDRKYYGCFRESAMFSMWQNNFGGNS